MGRNINLGTSAEDGFKSEIFQSHKLNVYNHILHNNRGIPVIFLFPLLTQTNRFSRSRGGNANLVNWLERMLFGLAIAKNPSCENKQGTKFIRSVSINGVLGPQEAGRPTSHAAEAKKLFRARVSAA